MFSLYLTTFSHSSSQAENQKQDPPPDCSNWRKIGALVLLYSGINNVCLRSVSLSLFYKCS